MAEIANVCLKLSNRAENVLVVRQALNGFAEALELDALEANDIATAVTEACNNVVLHAYGGEGEGPLEIEVFALEHAVAVVVRDRGRGIATEESDAATAQAGIGLPVMRALARRVNFKGETGGGTEVRMDFDAPRAATLAPLSANGMQAPIVAGAALANTIEMTLAPASVARTVLPRVLSALAARAYFSTDRISDVQLVADTLVTTAPDSIVGSHLGVRVMLAPRDLELRIGPLRAGSAREILASDVDGLGPVLGRLTDDQLIAPDEAAETLALRMLERR
jgi:serine/threonine-protein kinase RsbW